MGWYLVPRVYFRKRLYGMLLRSSIPAACRRAVGFGEAAAFGGHALPGVEPLSAVDCRATLPVPYWERSTKAVTFGVVVSVRAVEHGCPLA